MNRKIRIILLPLLLVIGFGLLTAGCSLRSTTAASPEQSQNPEVTPAPAETRTQFTVIYRLEGEPISTESVADGDHPAQVPERFQDRGIVSWKNANGTETDVWNFSVGADTVFDAVLGPELNRTGAYFAAESDGLFHPDQSFTRSDAVRAVYALLAVKPTGETFLKDVTTHAKCWQAATTLVTEGYISLDSGGHFFPDAAISRDDLSALLSKVFSRGAVTDALKSMDGELDRARAADVINNLLGLTNVEKMPYFPDVSPSHEDYQAVECAGIQGTISWIDGERAQPGFVNLDGYLYCVGEDGYFRRDTMVGTLYFDRTCRYTSGDESLDKYVADIIDEQIGSRMSREDMLRKMYEFVRDRYLYLKRSLYDIGETGWEIPEALVMFQTGKGNCYNFSGAFWALARGIGYDAVCYSGLVGVHRDPHSWVEIEINGVPYIFDPETEMTSRLNKDFYSKNYMLTYEQGKYWSYAREPYEDE